jgi:hypothetical protein
VELKNLLGDFFENSECAEAQRTKMWSSSSRFKVSTEKAAPDAIP